MAKASECKAKWVSWRGYSESNGKADKYIIQPWNKATGCKPPATAKKNPWCAIAVASCLIQIHGSGYSKASTCKSQKAYYKKHKRWIPAGQRPHIGDVIFVTGHEGTVTSTSTNGTGTFYSGNCKNSTLPSKFNWKTCKWGKKKVLGYGRPIWK